MELKYNGHACFTLKGDDKSIVIDPFGFIGYMQECESVDYCLCTHGHYDHHTLDAVEFKEVVDFDNYEKFDFVKGIKCFHDNDGGVKRGCNLIFVFDCDGITFCHMGDIGEPLNKDLVNQIGKVDVLMIPVGGNYTIDAFAARDYVNALKPKLVIPMHYKTKRSNIDVDGKQAFVSLFPDVEKCGRRLRLDRKTLPERITVLDIDDGEF